MASNDRPAAPKQDWLVVSMVNDDVSFGPFTEQEAKRFSGRQDAYQAFPIATLQRDIYAAARYGLGVRS